MSSGKYAAAVAELDRGISLLPYIKRKLFRECVRDGAQARLAMAKGGQAFLAAHPADMQGANRAADYAWKTYPMRSDCP